MRVLTVRQPWAWAIVHAGKDVENRSRNIAGSYRGPVAIHAGMGFEQEARMPLHAAIDAPPRNELVHGRIIGVVDLVDSHPAHDDETPCGRVPQWWALPDHHHLLFQNARALRTPVLAMGQLSMWTPDDQLAEQIRAALEVKA